MCVGGGGVFNLPNSLTLPPLLPLFFSVDAGVGGDNVASRAGSGIPGTSIGILYEALMTAGYTSEATDEALAKDIASAEYGQ